MTIKSDVIAVLASVSIYPGAAPADAVKPFVIYKVAVTNPINTIHGTCPITATEFTFECWAATALEAETLATSVRTLINASTLIREKIPAPEDAYDAQADEYVEPVAYRFWHT